MARIITAARQWIAGQVSALDYSLRLNSGILGATQISLFGTGADGNVTISSGTTTLTRDMLYNNLTLSGTGKINTAGFKIFVSGTLDISAAGAQATESKPPPSLESSIPFRRPLCRRRPS